MLKTISIVLTEQMIREIDEFMLHKNYSSRSDFFRHLVRLWQAQGDASGAKALKISNNEGALDTQISGESIDEFANVDCEYGIPAEVVERIKEIAKSKT